MAASRRMRIVGALASLVVLGCLGWCVLQGGGGARPHVPPQLAGRPRPQGDYWVSNVPRPTDLNPFTTSDSVALRLVLRYTHDTLLDLDPQTGSLRPALAELRARSADGLAFELALRPDAVFADGTPVEREDVAFTLSAIQSTDVTAGSMHDPLSAVAALDLGPGASFTLRLTSPYFAGIEEIGTAWRVCSRRWFVARVAEEAQRLGEPVPAPGSKRFFSLLGTVRSPGPGTGPYQLAGRPDGGDSALCLVHNPRSWRLAAYPDCWNLAGMKLTFVAGEAAALTELLAQRMDWWGTGDPQEELARHPALAQHYAPRVFDQAGNGNLFVMWSCGKPELQAAAVRQALTACFDRRFLVEKLMKGNGRMAASWFRWGSEEYGSDEPLPFAPQRARELLAAARAQGAVPLERVTIGFHGKRELHRQLLEAAVPAFAEAGLELVIQPLEFAVLSARVTTGELDGAVYLVSHDPIVDPYPWFHSSQRDGRGRNFMGYSDAEVDTELVAARTELDRTKRLAHWRRASEILRRDQPVTLLAHPRSAFLVHRRFQEMSPGFLGLVPERWWVEPAQRLYDDDGVMRAR